MTQREPLNLEQLLECLGSNETPGDSHHRYALRRALLKSRCFEVNQITAKWLRLFTLTTSAVAGGAVAVAFVLVVQTTLTMDIEDRSHTARNSLASENRNLRPMELINQMKVAEINEMVPYDDLRKVFIKDIDLAFTR